MWFVTSKYCRIIKLVGLKWLILKTDSQIQLIKLARRFTTIPN